MKNQGIGFVSLLAVIGVSIVFGMLVGGWLNTPRVALAATPAEAVQLTPAVTTGPVVHDFADVVEAALPSVVRVTSARLPGSDRSEDRTPDMEDQLWRFFFGPQDQEPRQLPRQEPRLGEGSGFFISADGFILTNNHVVEGADRVEVALQDGREFPAKVVGTDPSIDLALLKIDLDEGTTVPGLPLGDSASLRVGEWVIAIGNPLEFEHSVTVGVVSAKERRVPIGSTDYGVVSFIQTDAAINFGNSGGPLLDARGNVVGINTAIRRANFAEGIGFALPINHAANVIEQLREDGVVHRGYIGILMHPNGIDDAARDFYGLPDTLGVIVDDVNEDGPAERAGLKRFDIIRKVNGSVVRDNQDMITKIASLRPGDTVALEVFRNGKTRKIEAVLADRQEGLRARNGERAPSAPEDNEEEESGGLGLTVETLTPRISERMGLPSGQRGVLVTEVEFGSEAASKGITPMLVVTSVNDEPIRSVSDWNEALESLHPGDAVKLGGIDRTERPFFVYLRVPGD